MSKQRLKQCFHSLARFYSGAAVLLLNMVVLIVLVNVVLAVVFHVKDWLHDAPPTSGRKPMPDEVYARLYPGYSLDEVARLLEEFGKPLVYEPFVEFTEGERAGRYVNFQKA